MEKLTSVLFLIFLTLSTLASQAATDSIISNQIDSLIQISHELTNKNNFEKALEVNALAEKLALEKFGRMSVAYGNACFNHGGILYVKKELVESEEWYLESKDIREKLLGKESLDYAWSLSNLALLYNYVGKHDKSEMYFLESIQIRAKLLGRDHPIYASSLGNLAMLYEDMGAYEKAEPLLNECKVIVEKALGNEHPDFAKIINNLADFYILVGKYKSAEPLLIEARKIWEKALGTEHPHYTYSLLNLGNLYYRMGNFDKAELFYLETRAIREKVLGKEHPDYAWILNNLALLYWSTGNFEKSEKFFIESKAIREKTYGRDHTDFANSLGNLANLYYSMGNFDKAEKLYLECIKIREKLLGDKHPFYAECLSNLACLYFDIDNFEDSEPLLYIAKNIWEKSYGKDHPHYSSCLTNLGNLYYRMGDFEKAMPFLVQAREIWGKVLGKDNYEYGKSLNNLAMLNYSIGNYEESELQFSEAKIILEKSISRNHPDYSENLKGLAKLYENQKKFTNSELLLEEACQLDQARLVLATSFLSEFELTKLNATFKSSGANLCSFLFNRFRLNKLIQSEKLNKLVFDHVLFNKGFLLTSGIMLNNISLASQESSELHKNLRSYVRRLGVEYAKPIIEQTAVSELEERINNTEKKLARLAHGYNEANMQVKCENVQEKLLYGQATIEFVQFTLNFPKKTDSNFYAALVLLPNDTSPKFVPLFEEKELNQLLSNSQSRRMDYVVDVYHSPNDRGASPIKDQSKSLYELIWQPLEPYLKGVNKIYFSPSGLLHRINQNAVAINDQTLLSDKYDLVQLGSTRQLVTDENVKEAKIHTACIYGGINFEMDSTALLTSIHKMDSNSIALRSELSFSYTDSTLRGATWNYLKGSEDEANEINKIIQKTGIKSILFKGNEATEAGFKKLGDYNTESPQVIHVSTHGYFFPDPKVSHQATILSLQQEPVFKMSEHPMLRSGLIMAGANHAWKTGKPITPEAEDGILTAYEISQLNLRNTELVVLSACETGLGDIHGNEGVYGLQRAFKIAGAKNLIMSLWQVPDKQTSELMTAFYKYWLIKKKSIRESLKLAQNDLRKKGLESFYWAGFVLVE